MTTMADSMATNHSGHVHLNCLDSHMSMTKCVLVAVRRMIRSFSLVCENGEQWQWQI